jgi:hypothetical protein
MLGTSSSAINNRKRKRADTIHCSSAFTREASGDKISCIVNASFTVVDNVCYIFGGFHQYTGELYNDLYRLDLSTCHCSTVIYTKEKPPSARSDHSAALWNEKYIVIFGGDNEEDDYLNDVVLLNLETLTWERPDIRGLVPLGRSKHSATVYHNKMYVVGGTCRPSDDESDDEDEVPHFANEVCILNLENMTWERSFFLTSPHSHYTFALKNKLYIYGGINGNLDKTNDITFLDLETKRVSTLSFRGIDVPLPYGQHFPSLCGTYLVVVISQCSHIQPYPTGVWVLDLTCMEWKKVDSGSSFEATTWHYSALDEKRGLFYLLGAEDDEQESYFRLVHTLNLEDYGLLFHPQTTLNTDMQKLLSKEAYDIANDTSDFVIMSQDDKDEGTEGIGVHKAILLARWPHFKNVCVAQMGEVSQGVLFIPERRGIVKAFLEYLYTDQVLHNEVRLIAELLRLANLYCLPHLQSICCSFLHQRIDTENVSSIYHQASLAEKYVLKSRCLIYMCDHFSEVAKTKSFQELPSSILCEFWDCIPVGYRLRK